MHLPVQPKGAAAALVVVFLATTSVVFANSGDIQNARSLSAAFIGEPLAAGTSDAAWAVADIVSGAAAIDGECGQSLLPTGTVVDDVFWVNNIVHIRLTIPDRPDGWYLAPKDQETVAEALGEPFMADPAFGGTWIRVRVGEHGRYDTLEQFVPKPSGPRLSDELIETLHRPVYMGDLDPDRFGGPAIQAGRQPAGALSGVVIYASAGHGWTAGDTSWYLQRPILLGMCEDYGNIDQLNYFAAYAFNAGATVVPIRPVGWQPIEIILDQDDPGVTYAGSWGDSTASKYYENGVTNSGYAYKWASSSTTETATARYTPNITVTDFYPVYCFTIASNNRTLQTYRVSHSGGISEIAIDHRETGNGWIWLGDYYLEAGGDNWVEITNESPESGAIIAEAIRWGGGMGDIVRPGPGTISGYPRDEECQKYFAQKELGERAVGFDSDIWDIDGASDGSDNVRTGAKWAREMNQVPAGGVHVDRWKRIHIEFHTNASGGSARGQITLITDLGATTNQVEYANTLSDRFDLEMSLLGDQFEHGWVDRASATYTSSYGAICTPANDDEFDATIIECAFHDNTEDAQTLRDPRVRSAMARATLHGMIEFLSTLGGSQVPLAFAPDVPQYPRVHVEPDGDVVVSWVAPLSNDALGDPATGYVVYRSTNGYGFGDPTVLGDVTSATFTDIPAGETHYFRIAATNTGGESMPTEVLAVRKSLADDRELIIVNGYDRLRRQNNYIQHHTQPAGYAGDEQERLIWRRSNSFDYVVQHAKALAAHDYGFASCCNDAVSYSYVQLSDYDGAIWILGNESTEDATFSGVEQSMVSDFLLDGRGVFISGAELGYDLIGQGNGTSFMQDTLHVDYASDDAGTYQVTAPGTGILQNIANFDFDPANGAPYDARTPDVLTPGTDADVCLNYFGGGAAGIQYAAGFYNVVAFGFPFENITSESIRSDIMHEVVEFILNPGERKPFDYNDDNLITMYDFQAIQYCYQGPDVFYADGHFCVAVHGEDDLDIDLEDFALFQAAFTGD
jgi:hypothetical protein